MAETTVNTKQLLDKMLDLGKITGDVKDSGGLPFVVIPQDCKVQSLADLVYSRYADKPHRIVQKVTVSDAASFLHYYSLFSDPNSRVFADESGTKITAILDYHAAGEGSPRWCDHTLTLAFEHSDEWDAWVSHSGVGNKMTQIEFAEFVEDHTPDIVKPDAATMLEMARTLQAKTDVDYSSAVRLSNGQVQLTYNEQVKGTYGAGKVEIPESFAISIPVFTGSARTSIEARLRYRLVSGKMSIWYDLLRYKDKAREAFRSEVAAISAGLKEIIINGK